MGQWWLGVSGHLSIDCRGRNSVGSKKRDLKNGNIYAMENVLDDIIPSKLSYIDADNDRNPATGLVRMTSVNNVYKRHMLLT